MISSQHTFAGIFEAFVDFFDGVGRVFRVGGVQIHQHILGVAYRAGAQPRTHAHQPERGQIFVVDGEEHILGQHERHAHVARSGFFVEQEIRADMNVAVFTFEVAGGGFQVPQLLQLGQDHAIGFLDPRQLFVVWVDHVDPDRLVLQQFTAFFNLFLRETTFLHDEQIDHGVFP